MITYMDLKGLVLLAAVLTVAHAQFKTCAESAACSYLRSKEPTPDEFQLLTTFGVASTDNSITWNILKNRSAVLHFTAEFLADDTIRLQVSEMYDNRYYLDTALNGPPQPDESSFHWLNHNSQNVTMVWGGDHSLIMHSDPLTIELYHQNDVVAIFNADGRLTYDHEDNDRAVGFDIYFPIATHAYGLPLHADNLFLRQTVGVDSDPYRLYNLNVENYEVNSTKALSGTIPVFYAHGADKTAGVFFHNGYETWVDVDYRQQGVSTHFMVEDGVFEAFILLGPTPTDVYRQYTVLTGITPLPPAWALGYHHTVKSFDDQDAITQLLEDFDAGSFPIESIFIQNRLDRNFIWDSDLISDPIGLQNYLRQNGRKIVPMLKPTLSIEESYPLLDTVQQNNFVIFTPTRYPFTAPCDAGNCNYWDFVNPDAARLFHDQFRFINYPFSTTVIAGFWNEGNQPSVSGGEEGVLGQENVHYSGFSHKDVHNIYGHNMNEATYQGLRDRDIRVHLRTFVLAESFFAGSQRYAAIYTGKHEATWDHLRTSFKMCLTASLTAYDFCGGNIGGYFGNVDEELLARWYQLGAWLPFYRSHYSDESERREPYLLSTAAQTNIRAAINTRYTHLDYWYTVFYEHERFKTAVLQPLFFKYPADISIEHQESYFVGENIYVSPVTRPGISSTSTYLVPGEIWYDVEGNLAYQGSGNTIVSVYPNRIPTFYRGGSIVARKDNPQRNSAETFETLYTVYIFLNSNSEAHGTLFLDDRQSYEYLDGRYYYMRLDYTNGAFSLGPIDADADFPEVSFVVDRYLLYRPSTTLKAGLDKNPEHIEPEIFTHAPDGTPFSSTRLNLNGENIINFV